MYRDDDLRWFGRTRPAPLPRHYSIARVRKIFKEIYALDVVKIDYGYKGDRYHYYSAYQVQDSEGNIVIEYATLNALGDFLVREGDMK